MSPVASRASATVAGNWLKAATTISGLILL
jgi:hypothetical protein